MENFDLGKKLMAIDKANSSNDGGSNSQLVLKSMVLSEFLNLDFPPRESILSPWLPTQGLAMVYGPRGYGKTFTALGISIAVAGGASFTRWTAPKPRGVLYIDGEMPGVVLQERLNKIIHGLSITPVSPLKIITPDLQSIGMPDITTLRGQLSIEQHLDDISLVVIDNLSCLCRTGKENEGESWLPVQDWALRLRTRSISVLFIHHAGKDGTQRGTTRREDVLDTVITLKRPGDYKPEEGARFEVHFEKARGIYGEDVKPFEAQLTISADDKFIWSTKDLEESMTEKVAQLLNEGMAQKDIADFLKISKGTVSKHKYKAIERGLLHRP